MAEVLEVAPANMHMSIQQARPATATHADTRRHTPTHAAPAVAHRGRSTRRASRASRAPPHGHRTTTDYAPCQRVANPTPTPTLTPNSTRTVSRARRVT